MIHPASSRLGTAHTPSPLSIFIVENDADTLTLLSLHLASIGHQVESATTMTSALKALPESKCDVLLSDIGLPDGDGWELMRSAHFSKPVYAIAMSGFGRTSDLRQSRDAGFRHHLVKPFGPAELAPLLEDASLEADRTEPS